MRVIVALLINISVLAQAPATHRTTKDSATIITSAVAPPALGTPVSYQNEQELTHSDDFVAQEVPHHALSYATSRSSLTGSLSSAVVASAAQGLNPRRAITSSAVIASPRIDAPSQGLVLAQEPLNWVNNHECDPPGGAYDVTKSIKKDGSGSYPYSCTGLQRSMDEWSTAPDQWWHVVIDPGLVCSQGTPALTLKPKATGGELPRKCIVYESSNPPTRNQTVCSRGTNDNFSRNLGCSNDIAKLWTVEITADSQNAIATNRLTDAKGNGPSHVVLRDFEARPSTTVKIANAPVNIGTLRENTTASLPSHIHIQYAYVHGDAGDNFTPGSPPGNNVLANDFTFNCGNCSLMYSYTDKSTRPGAEGHAVLITQNPGPFKIVANWFEGMSSGVFLGTRPNIPNLVSATDGEIRRNRLTYPAAWVQADWGPGKSPVRKNASETKEAVRVLWDGNIFERVDHTGGQGAPCFLQNLGAGAIFSFDNYVAVIRDTITSNNIFRHCLGFQNNAKGGVGGATQGGLNIDYINNLIYDTDVAALCGGVPKCSPYRIPAFGSAGNKWTCSATRDTNGRNSTLTCLDPGATLHQTNIAVGDPVYVQGCSDRSFNTPTGRLGPAALAGTNPSGLIVVYPNPGNANATTTGCVLTNRQGWWKHIVWSHNTVVGRTGSPGSTFGPYQSSGPDNPFPIGATFQDNLWTMDDWTGLGCNGVGEGTLAEIRCWDTSTLTLNHDVFAERTALKYTEYPAGASPPASIYFPANIVCAKTIPDSSCIGYVGMLRGATFNQNPADYHDFRLCTGKGTPDARCGGASLYAAGQSRQASDGTALGADISKIDNAQVRTKYVCHGSCGEGPFPD